MKKTIEKLPPGPTDDLDIIIKDLYKTRSASAISSIVGLSHNSVLKHLRSMGVPIKTRGGANHTTPYLIKLFEEYPDRKSLLSDPELSHEVKAELLGCHPTTLRTYLKTYQGAKNAKKRNGSTKVSK